MKLLSPSQHRLLTTMKRGRKIHILDIPTVTFAALHVRGYIKRLTPHSTKYVITDAGRVALAAHNIMSKMDWRTCLSRAKEDRRDV